MAHAGLGRRRYAEWILRRLIGKAPEHSEAYRRAEFTLASLYVETGRFRRAEWLLSGTVDKQADHWHNLGIIRIRMKEFDRAAESYQRAVDLSPWQANHYEGLAGALHRIPGRMPDALNAYRRALGCGSVRPQLLMWAYACAASLEDTEAMKYIAKLMLASYGPDLGPQMKEKAEQLMTELDNGTFSNYPRQARSDIRWARRRGVE
jgi:tetratricopeptide (TPR) repeat protein